MGSVVGCLFRDFSEQKNKNGVWTLIPTPKDRRKAKNDRFQKLRLLLQMRSVKRRKISIFEIMSIFNNKKRSFC